MGLLGLGSAGLGVSRRPTALEHWAGGLWRPPRLPAEGIPPERIGRVRPG